MNVWHICIVNHLSKKVKILLFVWSLGVICTKQGASISSHSFQPVPFNPLLGLNRCIYNLFAYLTETWDPNTDTNMLISLPCTIVPFQSCF